MDIVAIHTLRDRGLIDFMMAVDDDLEINAKFRRTVIKDEVSRIEKMVRHLEDHGCTIPQRRVYATFPQFIAELFSALTKAEHTDWARARGHALQSCAPKRRTGSFGRISSARSLRFTGMVAAMALMLHDVCALCHGKIQYAQACPASWC